MQTENEKAVRGHMRDAFFAIHGEGKLDSTDEEFGLQCFKEGAAWQAAIQSQVSNTPQDGEMREKFERLISSKGIALDYRGDGIYGNHSVQLAWEALSELTPPQQQEQSEEVTPEQAAQMAVAMGFNLSLDGKWILTTLDGMHINDLAHIINNVRLCAAPPASSAVAAMALKRAADLVRESLGGRAGDMLASEILALTPAAAKAELEALMMKVADIVSDHCYEEFIEKNKPVDIDDLLTIVRRVLDEMKGK